MSESGFWRYIRQGMKDKWNASRHEDITSRGIPDVSFGLGGKNGWIELKILNRQPRELTILRLEHFTVWQKRWLINRGNAGGNCWFFLRLGPLTNREYLLFNYLTIDRIGFITRVEMITLSQGYWRGNKIDWDELEQILLAGP